MGSSKGSTTNVERPQSQQELNLLSTQNEQLAAGIAIAREQEDRANETHEVWKTNYLPHEVQQVQPSAEQEAKYAAQMDNQMPRYAEDTSGVRGAVQPQPQKRRGRSGQGQGQRSPQPTAKGA